MLVTVSAVLDHAYAVVVFVVVVFDVGIAAVVVIVVGVVSVGVIGAATVVVVVRFVHHVFCCRCCLLCCWCLLCFCFIFLLFTFMLFLCFALVPHVVDGVVVVTAIDAAIAPCYMNISKNMLLGVRVHVFICCVCTFVVFLRLVVRLLC